MESGRQADSSGCQTHRLEWDRERDVWMGVEDMYGRIGVGDRRMDGKAVTVRHRPAGQEWETEGLTDSGIWTEG